VLECARLPTCRKTKGAVSWCSGLAPSSPARSGHQLIDLDHRQAHKRQRAAQGQQCGYGLAGGAGSPKSEIDQIRPLKLTTHSNHAASFRNKRGTELIKHRKALRAEGLCDDFNARSLDTTRRDVLREVQAADAARNSEVSAFLPDCSQGIPCASQRSGQFLSASSQSSHYEATGISAER
jgi:hypothetical protein